MGTVHGVYLKYVAVSVLSFAGYVAMIRSVSVDGDRVALMELLTYTMQRVLQSLTVLTLAYSAFLNCLIAILFKLEAGMEIIGKNKKTGEIPWWSYVIFYPFHLPSMLYTHLHLEYGTQAVEKDGKTILEEVPQATEVQPGWWLGGCYAHKLDKDWTGIVDLTVEFPESCIKRTRDYLSIQTWDGVPASPDQIEQAACFAVEAQKDGDVLIHCAHGRGRSTTIMTACLVKAGLYSDWEKAFDLGIKPYRPCCKLNVRMRQNLTEWQTKYASNGEVKKEN
ncbi:hypothetical protein MPSEU_000233200 [Mayamaea pseudoterrestris]|nr:hypothetical protein MPSEU_000233200 [Mayamaea pseudoterrestris]